MAEKITLKKSNCVAVKNGKYWEFQCACGGKMFNNLYKKSTGEVSIKQPDLKCMNKKCDYGEQNGKYFNPNSVWLSDKAKEKLGLNKIGKKSNKKNNKQSVKKENTDMSDNSNVGTAMEVSYYGAWAKDIAIYLADKTKVTAWDDFQELYLNCLNLVGNSLERHIEAINKKQVKKDVKEVEDIEEPEESVEDVDDEEDPVKEIDDDFDNIDDDLDL